MTRIALPALFDLPAAATLADTLRTTKGAVVLDGSTVERIGIAGLQLLLSAQATAVVAGHSVIVDEPSDALRAAARTAGAGFLLASDR